MIDIDTLPNKNSPDAFTSKNSNWTLAVPEKRIGYRCELRLDPSESDGGFVAYVAQLKGVISEGDTKESAIKNIEEALRNTIEAYKADKVTIPWSDPEPKTEEEFSYWVVVNV